MEGSGKHNSFAKMPKLPGLMSFRQQNGCTNLPRIVLNRRMNALREPFYRLNLLGHYGCVNAIEFSNKGGEYLASGGDDRRILLWHIDEALDAKYEPRSMKGEHHSNIFCLAFDNENGKIYSGGNDDQVLVHDTRRGDALDVFLHDDAVYGLAVDPRNDNIYASACADGRVLLWDIRAPSHQDPFVLANYVTAFHAVVYHPQEPRFLATANAKEGIALWDVRAPKSCLLRYGSAYTQMNAMSVRFNQSGSQLLALRRRLPAVLYDIHSSVPSVEFNHEGYYNSCTMKSCCFGGDKDQFVLSGSDDFNLYIWRVPDPAEGIQQVNEAFHVLKGHRQIVNQVRFSSRSFLIASSGVEKVIKLWSAINFPGMSDGSECPRKMFSRQQYFNLMISSGSALSHDYSEKSKDEDPRMLAFFDSFIQREVDHSFSSDSSDDSALSPDSLYLHFVRDHSDANSSDRDGPVMPSLLPPEIGLVSNSDSNQDVQPRNGHPNDVQVKPKTTSSSDTAGLGVDRTSAKKSDSQERTKVSARGSTSHGSTESGETSRRQHSRSTTDSSSSSDESEDFLVMRYRSRLLRRIMRHKSKKGKDGPVGGKSLRSSPSQVEKDRLASLHQRLAFSRVMKERIAAASDSDSSMSDDNEQFLAIVGQLRQRTDSARQRAASLHRHRMRALEEISSLTGGINRSSTSPSLPSSRSPQRDSSTSNSILNRVVPSNHSSPSNSPNRIISTTTTSTVTASTSSHVSKINQEPSCSSRKNKTKPPKSKSTPDFASTSSGSKNVEAAGCSKDNELSSQNKDASKNGFKKFKINSSGKKRHYRSTNCYSKQKESDSD